MRPIWQFLNQFSPGTTARAEQVNDNLEQVEAAFDEVGDEFNRTIRFTDGAVPAEADFQVAGNAATRAGKVLAFTSAGTAIELVAKILNPRGVHATATAYVVGDVVQATNTLSLYYCLISHTSGVFATDLSAGRWQLVLDNTAAYQAARAFRIVSAADSPVLAQPGDDLFVDVGSGPVTINLPASPTISMQSISVVHADGDVVTNNITIGRNGQRIMSLTEDMTINTTYATMEFGFMDTTRGWRICRGT